MTEKELSEVMEAMGSIKSSLASLEKDYQNVNKFLLGNGQKGLLDRMTMIENAVAISFENDKRREEKLDKISCSLETLCDKLEKHVNDKESHTLKGLIVKKEVIATGLLVFMFLFILLHEGSEFFPHLLKIFGL